MYHALITAGGVGERFWPLSRKNRPKQLLKLLGDRSMLRMTVDRLLPLFPPERLWVVTGRILERAIQEELPEIPSSHIICEPVGKNTGPAIGLAALHIRRADPDASMVVQAADHAIEGLEAFRKMLEVAEAHARAHHKLVTCGFKPTRVGTGYGHIELGEVLETQEGLKLHKAERFIEKPCFEDADRYSASGRHLWNSGIFIWTLEDLWQAFSKHMPEMHAQLEALEPTIGTPSEGEAVEAFYQKVRPLAIEYGILEQAPNLSVIPGEFRWEDVGNWEGLRNVLDADADGNVARGDVLSKDVQDSTLISEDGLLCVVGLKDIVVIKSGDKVLVCPRDRVDDVRGLVKTRHG